MEVICKHADKFAECQGCRHSEPHEKDKKGFYCPLHGCSLGGRCVGVNSKQGKAALARVNALNAPGA